MSDTLAVDRDTRVAASSAARRAEEIPPPVRPLRDATRTFVIGLVVIALVALAIRLYFVLVGYDYYRIGGDAIYYHRQAWTVADGNWFIDPLRFASSHGRVRAPAAANPPLYTLYLAVVSRLGFWSVTAHRVASTFLGTGAVIGIGLTGRKVVNERVGLIAAAIAAVYANLWINDGMLLSESMAALTVAFLLLTAYTFWFRPTTRNAILLGVAFGLAANSRSEILFIGPLVAVFLLWGMRRRLGLARCFRLLVVTGLVMAALIAPWVIYNLSRFQKPVYMSDSYGSVLSAASCDQTYHGKYEGWYFNCHDVIGRKGTITGDASERDAVVRHEAVTYIKHHLNRLPVVMAARVGRLWGVWRPRQTEWFEAEIEGRTLLASRLAADTTWVLVPLAIAGLVIFKRRGLPISPIVVPIVVVTASAAMTFGVLRYRVSAEPGIVIAGATTIEAVVAGLVARRRARRDDTPATPGPAVAR